MIAPTASCLVRRRFDQDFVVHLQDETSLELRRAELVIEAHEPDLKTSAARPWMPAFMAWRSAA